MIEIILNGEHKTVDPQASVMAVLASNGYDCGRVAVAINSTFVARADYEKQRFSVGDRVDVVAPMAGG